MLRLSFATTGQSRGAAPIAPSSAFALARVLLGASNDALAAALRADLGLFGWAVEHFCAREHNLPESICALARFVSEHALPLLSAPGAFPSDPSPAEPSILAWSSRAPSIARLAVLLCDRPAFAPSSPEAAELQALLLCWAEGTGNEEKDEGGRRKDESEKVPAPPTHPSSFIPHPSRIAFDLFTNSTPPWSDERELLDLVRADLPPSLTEGTGNREQGTDEERNSPTHPSSFILHPSGESFPLQALIPLLAAPQNLETQKLVSLAEFAAGAGHEMNNPLAVISGRAQLLIRDERDPERRRDLATIHTQAMRVHEMIAGLMLFARPPAPRFAPCDARDILEKAIASLADQIAELNVTIDRDIPAAPAPHTADAPQLTLAIRAILENALQVSSGAAVHVALASSEDHITITIRDSGPGIPPEIRPHIFDPFFAGPSAGRGLGVGLSKAWRLITNHQGAIEVASPPEGGAEFKIVFNRVAPT